MNKLGIFGGTFNPIHKGHINLVRHFKEKLELDKVLVIPTNVPPHKQTLCLAPVEDRLAMCRLACRQYPFLQISEIEANRSGSSYTSETLEQLEIEYPNTEMYLLMGSDMFLSFEKWHNYPEIMNKAVLCTAAREDGQIELLKEQERHLEQIGGKVVLLEHLDVIDLSSTEMREMLKYVGTTHGYIDNSVERYILEHRLYVDTY